MLVEMRLQFNGKFLTLPINPKEIKRKRNASNTDIEIIGLGKTTRKGDPSLETFNIESFFPAPNSYFYKGVKPATCIDFINEIWNTENINNNIAKITTIGLPIDINMYFVIDNFEFDHRAGEEEDIYYMLSIKEYRPYGVKTVDVKLSGLAAARASAPAVVNNTPQTVKNTYTVQKNDCLWNIAKACVGDGSRWRELYDVNKDKIKNPNLIYPGQVLTLPDGWATPTNVPKLKDVATTTKNTTKGVQLYDEPIGPVKPTGGGGGSMGGR